MTWRFEAQELEKVLSITGISGGWNLEPPSEETIAGLRTVAGLKRAMADIFKQINASAFIGYHAYPVVLGLLSDYNTDDIIHFCERLDWPLVLSFQNKLERTVGFNFGWRLSMKTLLSINRQLPIPMTQF